MAAKSRETGQELNQYCRSRRELMYPTDRPESAAWKEAKKLIIEGNCDSTIDFIQDQIRIIINKMLIAQTDAIALIHSEEPKEKELNKIFDRFDDAVEALSIVRDCFDLDILLDLLDGEDL